MEINANSPNQNHVSSWKSIIERIARRFGGCVFILPVFFVPAVFTSFTTNTIVMKETILQFSVVFMILALPFIPRKTGLQWPASMTHILLALLIYLFLSLLWVSSHPRSEHEFLRWTSYILLALLSIPFASQKKYFCLYLTATAVTAGAISLYAIGQSFEIDFFYKEWDTFSFGVEGVRRVCGSMGNPDFLGGYLVAVIPLTAVMALTYSGLTRTLLAVLTLIELMALIFTYSRGAELALLLTGFFLFVILLLVWWKNPDLMQSVLSPSRAFMILCVACVVIAGLCIVMRDDISVTFMRLSQLGADLSTQTRPMYWKGALAMWMARPLMGFGQGTFPLFFPEFRPKYLADYQSFKDFYVEHAHNEYLEILSETGLIGFVLFSVFFILLAYSAWRVLKKTKERDSLVLLGLLGGILGILIHNLFTVTLRFTPSAFLLWSFSGVALGKLMTAHNVFTPIVSKWMRYAMYLLFAGSIPFLASSAIRNYVGDYHIRQSINWIGELNIEKSQTYNRDKMEDIFAALYKSTILIPDHVQSHYYLGLAYHKIYDYPQAIEAYERLESLQKDFSSNRSNLAISYMKQSDLLGGAESLNRITQPFPRLSKECLEDGMVWLKRGLESDPSSPDYHHFLGRMYYHLGEWDKAEKELRDALHCSEQRPYAYIEETNPEPDIHAFLGRVYFYQKKYPEAEKEFHLSVQKLQQSTDGDPVRTAELIKEINRYLYSIRQAGETPPSPKPSQGERE